MAKSFIPFLMVPFFLFSFSERARADFLFLRVENQRTKEVLLEIKVQPGDLFFYHYTHSADYTPIKDIFRVEKDGKMMLIEEAYLWYGAGLEFQDRTDVQINFEGAWTKVHLKRIFNQLALRIGSIASQTLIINDLIYPFTKFGKPGDALHLYLVFKEENG